MGLFDKAQPVILKEGSSELAVLQSLRGSLPAKAEKQLEADIRNVQAGLVGEDRILYELKSSHMDMYVLQDLFLEHGGLAAQIDFLVITPQRTFVLECKNLYGDIEVNARGEFIRSFGGRKKEGIYSPVTQNQRHMQLIHAMRRDDRGAVASDSLEAVPDPRDSRHRALDGGQVVLCPKCGAPMVLRTARRGERAGKQFYGCSDYPRCRGVVNVE